MVCYIALRFCIQAGVSAQTMTDYDGNIFPTITIGTQVWMMENLKVKHYNNGDPVSEIPDSVNWVNQSAGAWCYFDNIQANGDVYGLLYNGFAITDPRGISPPGWHVPSDDDWKQLEIFLGMSQATADLTGWRGNDEGAKLKETDTLHWKWPTGNAATNVSGFTALGNGWRNHFNPPGYTSFVNLTHTGQWWTSSAFNSELWIRNLCVYHTDVYRTHYPMQHGCAIRLVMDFPVGMHDMKGDSQIQLYPNPSGGKFTIWLNGHFPAQVVISDLYGREILNQMLWSNTNNIDISQLPQTLYLVTISTNEGTSVRKLFIAK